MSHLPIWRFLVLFSIQENEFGAEIWWRWYSSRLIASREGISKIFIFMWSGSLQKERLSAYILKHIIYYFGGFFGDWPSLKSCCKCTLFIFVFTYFYYFSLIKTSEYVFSWDLVPFQFSYLEKFYMQFLPRVPSF